MGISLLVLGLVLFLGPHLAVRARQRRAVLVGRFGESRYKLAFTLVTAVGLGLIVYGFAYYRAHEWVDVWYPPRFLRHVTVLLTLPAVILLLAAYLPGHLKTWTKHPMLAAVKLWAFGHLLSNGDLGSILLFGSFLGWAVFARIALKRAERANPTPQLEPVRPGWRNDALAVFVGIAVYLAIGYVFHPIVIGVPVFGA
jgi:uncharacterized membrane protein